MTTSMITYSIIVERLNTHNVNHRTIKLKDGSLLLVSQRGARIYGPFRPPDYEVENWVPEAFADAEEFAKLIKSEHWNIGGERLWIGPEIQYMIQDRDDYWESYKMPPAMDPGVHEFHGTDTEWTITRHSELEAFTLTFEQVKLDLQIRVHAAEHPLRFTQAYIDSLSTIQYAGYTQRVRIVQEEGSSAVSESWNLAQVRAGGHVVIPATCHAEVTDYYEPVGNLKTQTSSAVYSRVTGDRRYKFGIKAAHVNGRVGYFRLDGPNHGALLIRNFGNDPSSVYTEESDFAIGKRGDSVHVYNDDGALGGFGEVESRGRTIAGDTGRRVSEDEFTSWWFFGTVDELQIVGEHLLGVDIHNDIGANCEASDSASTIGSE